MPIRAITGSSPPPNSGDPNPSGDFTIVRVWYLTDKNGVQHKIDSSEALQAILDQMTPEELEIWKARLRFEPFHNKTGILDYTGTLRDC